VIAEGTAEDETDSYLQREIRSRLELMGVSVSSADKTSNSFPY